MARMCRPETERHGLRHEQQVDRTQLLFLDFVAEEFKRVRPLASRVAALFLAAANSRRHHCR
jgi:hypothetical protein